MLRKCFESTAVYSYEYETPTQRHSIPIRHDPTPQYRRRWLSCCRFRCCSPRVSVIHPYLRPSAARDSTQWPQCALSMTFRQLLRWRCLSLASLEEVQLRDGLQDELEENPPRVKLTPRCSRTKRDISMYVWLGAAAGR